VTGQQNEAVGQDGTDLNKLIRYTMWSVFKVDRLDGVDRGAAADELQTLLDKAAEGGVTTRGSYDVQGFRADADIMFWWVADTPEQLQDVYTAFLRTEVGRVATAVWSVMGLHRPAEFNRGHVPAFLAGEEPRDNICVYPFVRSYEWYLLPAEERGKMLRDHGMLGREFPQVLANTVASFALGDWEWILGLEAPNLVDLVDMMRHLRSTEARNHVREEIPFYTGRRIPAAEVSEVLR